MEMEMESKVEKLEADVQIKAPAKQFYDVLCSRTHHLANVCPDKVHGIDLHEGEWGSHGSIIFWNYVHDGKKCVAKEMVEMDKENYKMTFNVLEGDLLEDYKSFRFLMELLPQEEGTIVHWTLEYEKREGHSPDPHTMLQFDIDMTKQVDDHLAAQPNDPQATAN